MVLNQKPTGRTASIPTGLAIGAGVSLSVTILGALILTWMISTGKMEWEKVGYGIMLSTLLAAFLGAITSFSRIKRQRFMICIMSGLVYMAILLSITALLFGGQYDGVGVIIGTVLAGSLSAGLLGLKGEKKKVRAAAGKYHKVRGLSKSREGK